MLTVIKHKLLFKAFFLFVATEFQDGFIIIKWI